MKYSMGLLKTEWGCSGAGEKSVGLLKNSLWFPFNGAVTGGSQNVKICRNQVFKKLEVSQSILWSYHLINFSLSTTVDHFKTFPQL